MKKAFTLIELLVVIAIIAILAAILFPVFAQAKLAAKKTVAISNIKNLSLATLIYTTDSDDLFPICNIYVAENGRSSYNRFIPTPASLATGLVTAATLDTLGTFYTNSLANYTKSAGIWDDAVATSTQSIYTLSIANGMPFRGGTNYAYAMNGLLNSFSTTAVNAPSSLIMFSQDGNRKTPGAWFTNPTMYCETSYTAPCRYSPGVAGCGTSSAGNGTASFFSRSTGGSGWDAYGGQWVTSFTDGHAKTRKIGVFSTGKTDPRVDPFASYGGTNGSVTGNLTRWYSNPEYSGCHAYMFRPDLDFSTWDAAVSL
jgi:prepilin-type N-terminal cleavage/methylation domain-containing protein